MIRRKLNFIVPILVLAIALPASVLAAAAPPVASTDWLAQNLKAPNQVIIDIRKVDEYKAGHIPDSVSAVYETWAVKKGALLNEIPAEDDLRDALGAAGITPDGTVVVVGKTDTPPDRFNIARVAWTMKYAGVKNVSILNGAATKWMAEKKPVSTTPAKAKATTYSAKFNPDVLATKDYLKSRIGTALIVDSREPDFYSGKKKLEFVAKPGHIKSAVNLPTSQVFNADGTYKDKSALAAIAAPVVGSDLNREIIVYCDSGRVAATWWYMLSQVLGYKNVRNYDGSVQEWTSDPNMPVE